jgi:hypothetical protein
MAGCTAVVSAAGSSGSKTHCQQTHAATHIYSRHRMQPPFPEV